MARIHPLGTLQLVFLYFYAAPNTIYLKANGNKINQELMIRLKNGDMVAFDLLYEQYSHKLFSFVLKILKNETDAEEIVQEVFVRLWESRFHIDDSKLLNSFIFTIAYNHSIDLIRKRINNKKYLEHLKYSSAVHAVPSQVDEFEFEELNDQVKKLIADLPERQRQIYLLHREEGLTYSEIANRLGISKNTVENHMTRALKYLRTNLDNTLLVNLLFIYLFL
ncbi:MAG: RNA polymerase sigma factor [Mangrovibacterium sp.]